VICRPDQLHCEKVVGPADVFPKKGQPKQKSPSSNAEDGLLLAEK